MEKQQHQHPDGAEDDFQEERPELAYRNADYDTDPGVLLSRRRVGVGAVDIRRSRGRGDEEGAGKGKGRGRLGSDGNYRGWCSDGDDGELGVGRGLREGTEEATRERA